jgi:hypothetical protein
MFGCGSANKHARIANPGKIGLVKTIPLQRARNQKPKEDPHFPAAVKRAREAARRLQEAGIIDAEGRRIRKDLPADMQEGKDRDFGG